MSSAPDLDDAKKIRTITWHDEGESKIVAGEREIRSVYERDHDKMLYSPWFRRLSETTQVTSRGSDSRSHNRLTHSVLVAQVARRLAERLKEDQVAESSYYGLDPSIAETAGLAHDIGHAPFGHIGEAKLNELTTGGSLDGFEGNAQTFRILTRLAVQSTDKLGLNLSRALLISVLKYPWTKGDAGEKSDHKFGVYKDDEEAFLWATKSWPKYMRTAEAEIMDFADDIAYSIHDMDDFFRAGRIPLNELVTSDEAFDKFLIRAVNIRTQLKKQPYEDGEYHKAWRRLREYLGVIDSRYDGSKSHDARLRGIVSSLVQRYVDRPVGAPNSTFRLLNSPTYLDLGKGKSTFTCAHIQEEAKIEIALLKELTGVYVIADREFMSIQRGQAKMLEDVFNELLPFAERYATDSTQNMDILPAWSQSPLDAIRQNGKSNADVKRIHAKRVVCDIVSGYTETEVMMLHRQLFSK